MKRPIEHPELEELSRGVGEIIEFWGFKQIHGVIWTHLFLSPEPLSASTLVTRLGVSKALMSLSIKELLRHRVILPVANERNRKTKFYVANSDLFPVIQEVLENRELRMIANIVARCHHLKASLSSRSESETIAPEKLESMLRLSEEAEFTLRNLLTMPGISPGFLKKFFQM